MSNFLLLLQVEPPHKFLFSRVNNVSCAPIGCVICVTDSLYTVSSSISCCNFKIQSIRWSFVRGANSQSCIGLVDALDNLGWSGRWRSMGGMAFADDGGNPSKRKAAQVL